MNKKLLTKGSFQQKLTKLLRTMKLAAMLILLGTLSVNASVYSQATKLNLSSKGSTIRQVFDEIEKQSKYKFFYFNEQIDDSRKVNIQFTNKTVEEVLNQLFDNKNVKYKVFDNNLVVISPVVENNNNNVVNTDNEEVRQKQKITGSVIDAATGEAMPGVNVVVEGTTVGVSTDVNGKFSINVTKPNAILIFSFIGYNNERVALSGQNAVNVKLISEVKKLDEVVVVGYGQQKKASVVGSIVQTKGDVLERAGGVSNIGSALTGALPGVITVSTTGSPGNESPKIYIRGSSTWNNSDPLVLVDGIERDMSSVDISSVENISVLKDASATAVYGVKGANGVILITTKRGQEGKANIRVTINNTMKMPSKLATKYDAYDALRYRDLSIERELGLYPSGWGKYTPYSELYKYRNPSSQAQAELYPNIDWQDALVKKFTMDHNASLNISGGTQFVKYFTSIDYQDESDILKHWDNGKTYDPGYGYQRWNVRSNVDINLTKTTVFSANLAGSYGVKQDAYGQDAWEYRIWQSIYSVPPDVYYPRYSDGSWGYYPPNTVATINSASTLANNGVRKTTTKQINTDYTLSQDLGMILKGLSVKGTLSFDNTFVSVGGIYDDGSVQEKYIDPVTGVVKYSRYLGTNQFDWIPYHWGTNTDAANNAATFRKLYYQVQMNYAQKFGEHNVTGMGLFSRDNYASGNDFPYLREDWVGRFTYDYASKYFIEVNGAYNGSERFSSDHRFAFFPSTALGWMITEEKFMKNIKFLNVLKLRASWGQVGSDNYASSSNNRWLYMTQWGYGGNASLSTTGGSSPYAWWYVKSEGNTDIHWEKVTKKNLGIDYAFLGGLFAGSVDFFHDYRTDILLDGGSRAVPSYFGTTPATANLGKVRAHGYEISLRVNKQLNKNLRVWGDFNMSHSVNKIIEADDPQLKDEYQKKEGKSIGQNYSYVTNGYYNNWDQVYGSTKLNTYDNEKLPGTLNVIDYNADGVIDNKDQAPYGYPETPQNTYNATIGCEWKGFSLLLQFYGVNNCNRYLELKSFSSNLDNVYKQGSYWSKDNTTASSPLPRWNSHMDYYSGSTLYLYDGSYLRLKNVEIAYTFKQDALKEVGINSLRIYLNGDNLLLWTKMPDDREVNMGNSTAYPTVRRVNLGLNVTF